jgi:hypothetical protein
MVEGGDLRDIGRVFPLLGVTTWLAGEVRIEACYLASPGI